MESSRFEGLALIAATIGAAILSSQQRALGFGEAAIGDIVLLLALFAFDSAPTRSGVQSIAVSSVASFCLLTPLLFLANTVLGVVVPQGTSWILFGVWLIATLILFSVDRFRIGSSGGVSLAEAGMATPGAIKPIVAAAPTSNYRPAPLRVAPVATPQAYEPPAQVVNSPVDAGVHNVSQPAVPQGPPPDVTAIPPGREALIYLNLVGEGLNVLRTVRAENLGRDYYRIADVMPEGEQWEFTPGMVVRCRKKNLSNGKHMVAYEEAPRAV